MDYRIYPVIAYRFLIKLAFKLTWQNFIASRMYHRHQAFQLFCLFDSQICFHITERVNSKINLM